MINSASEMMARHGPRLFSGRGAEQSAYVDWTAYAKAYDLLLEYNPAYRAMIEDYRGFVDAHVEDGAACLDIGAGTGNFSTVLARMRQVDLTLLEPDGSMMQAALAKPELKDARACQESFQGAVLGAGRYDVLTCTHVLYIMDDSFMALSRMRDLLRPGGYLFLIDLGKHLSLLDWGLYLTRNLLATEGARRTVDILRKAGPILSQNKEIRRAQDSGRYWHHTPDQLREALEFCQFDVLECRPVYRGYSTLCICRAA